jgi:DMSO reductase anchor subunit
MKIVFLLFAFAVPLLMLAVDLSHASVLLLCVAFVSQYIGLLAERWYFFAEARHPQNIYYQGVS